MASSKRKASLPAAGHGSVGSLPDDREEPDGFHRLGTQTDLFPIFKLTPHQCGPLTGPPGWAWRTRLLSGHQLFFPTVNTKGSKDLAELWRRKPRGSLCCIGNVDFPIHTHTHTHTHTTHTYTYTDNTHTHMHTHRHTTHTYTHNIHTQTTHTLSHTLTLAGTRETSPSGKLRRNGGTGSPVGHVVMRDIRCQPWCC